MNQTCPGCGYQTNVGEGDICPVCYWERDTDQEATPYKGGSANHASLNQHQLSVQAVLRATDMLAANELAGFVKDPEFRFIQNIEEV